MTLILDPIEALDAVRAWRQWKGPKGLDFETCGPTIRYSKNGEDSQGPDPYRHRISGIALAWEYGGAGIGWERGGVYIAVDHPESRWSEGQLVEVLGQLKSEMVAPNGRLWIHDARYELQMMRNHGFPVETSDQLCDSIIAAWLAGARFRLKTQSLKLKNLARLLGKPTVGDFKDIAKKRQVRDIPAAEVAPYAARDAELAVEVGEWAYALLRELSLVEHFHQLDMPLVEVVRSMSEEGQDFDVDKATELGAAWRVRMDGLAAEFKALTECEVDLVVEESLPTGEFFKNGKPKFKKQPVTKRLRLGADIGNDRLVSRWLYEELKWWPVAAGLKRNDNGVYPVGKDLLLTLTPTCAEGRRARDLRLEYQRLSKLRGTYVENLINIAGQYADGRLHPSFNIHGTDTQRFSSANPNDQNVPKSTDEAKELMTCRRPRAGWVEIETDLSQIELRLMAHFSQDPALMQAYQFGEDLHASTMALVGCERRPAKVLNFSGMYRIGKRMFAQKLAVQLKRDVSEDEAEALLHKLTRQAYPGVPRYWERAMAAAKRLGYVNTIDGFKQFLDVTEHKTRWGKMELLWQTGQSAITTRIQGSAGGIVKIAMRDTHRLWRQQGTWGVSKRYVSQVHDSLRYIAKPEVADEAQREVEYALCNAVTLRVPVECESKRTEAS